jgi:GNAT superfamily N-acetyltransferase
MGRAWRPGSPGEKGLPRSHLRFRVAVRVEEATAASTELTAAMGRLVGQLSSSARAPTEAELQELVDSPATRLLVARDDDGTIVGSLTLALFRISTGLRAWIEDVVVDQAARGQGVGETLTMEARRRHGPTAETSLAGLPRTCRVDRCPVRTCPLAVSRSGPRGPTRT